tara:strand:+ start:118 stop:657 length:540 start_codon:yes stop_codon:yes gene_type:complete
MAESDFLYFNAARNGNIGTELPITCNKVHSGMVYFIDKTPYGLKCTVDSIDEHDMCIKLRQGNLEWFKFIKGDGDDDPYQPDIENMIQFQGDKNPNYPTNLTINNDYIDIINKLYLIMKTSDGETKLKLFLRDSVEDYSALETLVGKCSETVETHYKQNIPNILRHISSIVLKKWILTE